MVSSGFYLIYKGDNFFDMKLLKDRGIILKTEKSGETSLKVRLFARDSGRILVTAKGARKPESPFFGLLTPFSVVDFEIAYSPYNPFLRSVSRMEYFPKINQDTEKIVYASMLLEIVDKTGMPHEDIETLRLLYKGLRGINTSISSPEKIHWWFIIHFLKNHGVWPNFETCTECQKPLTIAILLPDSGGLFCQDCAGNSQSHGLILSSELRRIIVFLENNPLEKISAIKINKQGAVTLTCWLWKLLSTHYESTTFLNTKKAVERLL